MPAASAERGSATVAALALVLVLVAAGTAALGIAQFALARQRAATAADLAALAGATWLLDLPGRACDQAGRVARDNGARVDSCRAGDPAGRLVVVVTVSRDPPPLMAAVARLAGQEAPRVRAVGQAGPEAYPATTTEEPP